MMRESVCSHYDGALSARTRLAPVVRQVIRSGRHSTSSLAASRPTVPPAALELVQERGVTFTPGAAFYRAESAQGRDLAVLAAALYKQQHGSLRVLDVMAGSGMRGARYLQQAGADMVWCNDYSPANQPALVYNLVSSLHLAQEQQQQEQQQPSQLQEQQQSHQDQQGALLAATQKPHGWQNQLDNSHSSGGQTSSSSGSSSSDNNTNNGSGSSSRPTHPDGVVAAQQLQQWQASAQQVPYPGLRQPVLQWGAEPNSSCGSSHADDDTWRDGHGSEDLSSSGCAHGPGSSGSSSSSSSAGDSAQPPGLLQGCRVSQLEASRLLAATYLAEDYYDFVDVDSFGSDTAHLPAAIDAVKYGGMLYLTSTDGFCSGGKRSTRSLAAYGAYLRAIPSAAEQGLRMVIGAAVKEAAARGVVLQPLFSLYSFHGPVFRVLLRVTRSREWPAQHYGFLAHCYLHGQTYVAPWDKLGGAACRCCRQQLKAQRAGRAAPLLAAAAAPPEGLPYSTGTSGVQEPASSNGSSSTALLPQGVHEQVVIVSSRSGYADEGEQRSSSSSSTCSSSSTSSNAGARPTSTNDDTSRTSSPTAAPSVLSGPQWTGPLHDAAFVVQLAAEAEVRGWRGSGVPPNSPHMVRQSRNNKQKPLQELLALLVEEGDSRLPPWFLPVDLLAQHLAACPSRDKLIAALRARGFAATRCHVEARALRTNATTQEVLHVALQDCGYKLREDSPYATILA